VYAPVYAEPQSLYGDTSFLYGDANGGGADVSGAYVSGADAGPDFGDLVGPLLPAAGPALARSLQQSVQYVRTLAAQAASAAGLSASQGSTPADAVNDASVTSRSTQAANQFLKHQAAAPLAAPSLQKAAAIAHAHVRAKAQQGAASAPPAGWTMQPISAQRALAILGLYKGAIDGIVNPATKDAAKAFQAANNLKADGVVGVHTQPVLEGSAKQALGTLQGQLRSAFGSYYRAPSTVTAGFGAGALAAVKAGIFPALGGLLGGIFGSRWGKPGHRPLHAGHPVQGARPRPPAWPHHMVSGAEDAETIKEALKKALQGLPLDPGQSDALKRYLKEAASPPPGGALPATSSGGYLPVYYGQDWIGNPEDAYMAVGWDPTRIAVGRAVGGAYRPGRASDSYPRTGGPLAALALGAAAYAAVDGYRHGFPHVAETVFGERMGGRVVDATRRVSNAIVQRGPVSGPTNVAGYAWRGWYGRPGTGLPQRMRAGIDTSTQSRPDLSSPAIESLAASMRRSVA
jgi:peptidoglycan hydrolase-like protein with peptidoglycan-binding domain